MNDDDSRLRTNAHAEPDAGARSARPGPSALAAVAARAFAGVRPVTLFPVVAIVALFALRSNITELVLAAREHRFAGWLANTSLELLSFTLLATLMFTVVVAAGNLGAQSGWRRNLTLGVAIVAIAPVAAMLRVLWLNHFYTPSIPWSSLPPLLAKLAIRYAFLAGMLSIVGELYRREKASHAAMLRAEVDRARLEREMAQARLQVLQAQIEPHFLFNTLANVRRLYETDVPAGHRMLRNLMRYFEVALPSMRDGVSTLGRDATLIGAYLDLQQIRMGRRLVFTIDVAPSLHDCEIPPMMLLTLVENAIKHGLNPLPEGGSIVVVARAIGDRLVVEVADTGRGFGGATSGGGTGLANIRARLAAEHGDVASLDLAANTPHGVVATLTVPRRTVSPPVAATA